MIDACDEEGDLSEVVTAETVVALIGRVVGLRPHEIDQKTALRELGFDSLRHFQLMLDIEHACGRDFSEEEVETILACSTVGELCTSAAILADGKAGPAKSGLSAGGAMTQPGGPPATDAEQLIRLSNECWVSRALHGAVRLRLADHLAQGTVPLADLARKAGMAQDVLAAILGVLQGRGIFTIEDGVVGQTSASALLQSDHPDGVGAIIEWMGSDEVWNALGMLPRVGRNSAPAFEVANGQGLFAYLADHPDRSALFDRHMEGYTRREADAILDAVDLSRYRSIADIGAGSGVLAARMAARHRHAQITVFDLPGCRFTALTADDRIRRVHGDFFKDPLPRARLTILCNVLHDWDDDAAETILRNIARNCPADAELYVIEGLPEAGEEKVAMVNLGMAVTTGGRQRSQGEYATLLGRAGFALGDVLPCSRYHSVLKARRA